MPFKLPELPYAPDALEPYISARTLEFHHGKHHRGYVDKLNRAIVSRGYTGSSLEELIVGSNLAKDQEIFNNAAQAWNHEFLWLSMSPAGGGEARGPLKEAIDRHFGNLSEFCQAFKAAATEQFGSGWAWLVLGGTGLKVVTTSNAETPLTDGLKPLLNLDLWEHAYYLDYQSARGGYIDNWLKHLINWEFASANYSLLRKAA